jgi:hypothetical protein
MMEIGLMARDTGRDCGRIFMEMDFKGLGCTTELKDLEFILGQQVINMKENGSGR